MNDADTGFGCPCRRCLEERGAHVWWMVACARCGNKRCPHGADHRKRCLESNRPNQELVSA